jgi:DNA-binding response OmpR family regulator
LNKLIEKINILTLKESYQSQSEKIIKDYSLNLNDRTILRDKKKTKLTEKELQLILFLNKKNSPQNITTLQNEIWGYKENLETHTVETHIYRLRKKIEKDFSDKNFINSNKEGYFL